MNHRVEQVCLLFNKHVLSEPTSGVPYELGLFASNTTVSQIVVDISTGNIKSSAKGWNQTTIGSYIKLLCESVYYTYRAYALKPGVYVYGYNAGDNSTSTVHMVILTTANVFPYELRTNNEQISYVLAY